MSNYDTDLYAWTWEQADALRRRAANGLDWNNLAEEIESLGKSDRRQIQSRLEVLLIHLLKWRYQPESRCCEAATGPPAASPVSPPPPSPRAPPVLPAG